MSSREVKGKDCDLEKSDHPLDPLPLAPAPGMRPSPLLADAEREQVLAGLRVLVVDDNADMADGMAMLLKEAGHETRISNDGHGALQAAVDYGPHVVLLDIGLPGLDGYEVARRIRMQPLLQSVVLVALTGHGQEADRQASLKAGFDYHLVKPADFANVIRILDQVRPAASPI